MTAVKKIDGNDTSARYSQETSLGVADGAAVWKELEPNSYSDFGGEVTTVARAPIVADRQRKKGVTTDLEASGGISGDVTQEALPDLGQGAFFADIRSKNELSIANVDTGGAANDFEPVSGGDAYLAGDLLFAQGFDDTANNGLHEVLSSGAATVEITGASVLVTAATQTGTLRLVGFQFAIGDLDVTTVGDFVTLTTTTKDLTELQILPGEYIFVGGDTTGSGGDQFTNAANNGLKRVRSVSANAMVLDKSESAMITEADTTQLMKIFVPSRMLKNESDPTEIVRRSYQIERTLGAPDDAFPALIQSQYLVGGVVSTLQLNLPTADKATFDITFMATDEETRTAATGVKPGTRPDLTESDAFNTSSDIARINMNIVSTTSEAPSSLLTFIQDINFTIDNTLSYNKAVGTLGAFDITKGMFAVSGSMTAYFDNVAIIAAVRANEDITLDYHMVKENKGISVDFPLVTIGDGQAGVETDTAVMIPISFDAASGAKVDATLDHTVMMLFWDYLPTVAAV